MLWVETKDHCWTRVHCQACRNSRSFRKSIFKQGMASEVDFACPWAMDPPKPTDGPGTRLYRILHRMGFKEVPGCVCRSLTLEMNKMGKETCRERVDYIVEQLRKSAANPEANPCRVPFLPVLAKKLVLHCCR